MLWQSSALLFLYYLTEICGLSPKLAGMAIGATLLLSAVADGLVGAWLGRTASSSASAKRQQLIGIACTSAAFAAFCLSGLVEASLRASFVIATLIAFRLLYAMADVPQNALLSLFDVSNEVRAKLVGVRLALGGVATIVVTGLAGPLLINQQAKGSTLFALLGLSIAIIATASAYWLARCPQESGDASCLGHGATGRTHGAPHPVPMLFPVAALMVMAFGISLSTAIFERLEAYLAAYGMRGATSWSLMTLISIGNLMAQFLWIGIHRRLGSMNGMLLAAFAQILAALGFGLFARGQEAMAAAVSIGCGIAFGAINAMLWTLLAQVASSGIVTLRFATFTAVSKTAQALAAFLLGYMLDANSMATLAAPLSPLSLAMVGAPIVGALVCMVIVACVRAGSATISASTSVRSPGTSAGQWR